MTEFTQIEFDCKEKNDGHTSSCDIDLICPTCTAFYRKDGTYYFWMLAILFVGIFYSQLVTNITTFPKISNLLFLIFFIIVLFFLGSALRNRSRELLTSFGAFIPTTFAIVCIYGIENITPPNPDIIILVSFLLFFVSFLMTIERGYQDAKIVSDNISSIVILVIITNLVITFLHLTLKIFVNIVFTEYLQIALKYTGWILTIRIFSVCLIALLLFIYAIKKALIESVTPKEVTRKKYEIIETEFGLFKALKVISNIVVDSSIAIEKGLDVIKKRVIICYKEFKKVGLSSLFTTWLLLLRILRFVLISIISIGLALTLREASIITSQLWQSKFFFGMDIINWGLLLILFIALTLLLYLLSLSSYKKWNNFTKGKIYDSIIGSRQEISIATSSIFFSIILYLFYLAIILFIGWFFINLIEAVITSGWPKTFGITFSFTILLAVTIIILVSQNFIDTGNVIKKFQKSRVTH